ncbi:Vegetative incompatibility protein HET-E-1 [Rhizoctonia solani]|uniref:Vegetative incompatibility protein HET-E-1 n=1 Tax=Rhizoctonia solani TaxID=456999 RepID=A0A8H8SXR6_9AGAM|nr:Vegetative incompatibility protein HET-E-1 [Rhizoctonia solani]QRW22421.1 Vegetative incompatibility protein HET-E-1 [Rhizoctonia solani]
MADGSEVGRGHSVANGRKTNSLSLRLSTTWSASLSASLYRLTSPVANHSMPALWSRSASPRLPETTQHESVVDGYEASGRRHGSWQRAVHVPSYYKRSEDERSLPTHPTTTNNRKMSTANNRSNRKKGKVRRWLDSLLCVSSPEDPVAPSIQQRSSSHASLPLEPIQDFHTDTPNDDNTAQQGPSHASLPAEPTQSAHVDSANDENAPLPTGQPSAQISTPPDTSGVKNGAWAGLRLTLKTLRDTPAMFGPLASAANVLLDCFDTIEAVARNQQDYEQLATELDALSKSLVTTCNEVAPGSAADCVAGIVNTIKREANEIDSKLERGTGRRALMANADEQDLMRRYRRIQSLFRQLQTNIGMSTWANTNELVVKSRLGELNAEKKATYDSQLSGPTNRRTCTEGTRVKVLDELKAWVLEAAGQSVYWMSGMAGTGKTTIACTFAKWLEAEKLLAASFFCTRTSTDCQDVTRIIPTVAYQLAQYSIPFRSALCDILGNNSDIGSKDIAAQFEKLILEPLNRMKDDIPDGMVVVIDALDECKDQGGVGKLLDMLFKHAAQLPVRFFVTSRPESGIYATMAAHAASHEAIHLHKIEESLVSADIKLYLEEVLAPISPQVSDIEELVRRSGVLFIYAATLFRYILPTGRKANSQKRLRDIMAMAPEAVMGHAQIDLLYTVVLKSALEDEETNEEEKNDVRAVLNTVLLAQEPIGIQTIAALGGVGDTSRVEYALRSLSSVLYESGTGLVSTLHASFPDFMFDDKRSGTYFCDAPKHSLLVVRRCFEVMKKQLRMNICNLPSSFMRDKDVKNLNELIESNISPLLTYVCRYWANHLRPVLEVDEMQAALGEFVSTRLLFWMEVLSVRSELSTGAGTVQLMNAKQWLTSFEPQESRSKLAVTMEDAINFVAGHITSPASESTPHIYISSLPFCARSSYIYKHYWPRMQGLVELKGSLMDRRETAALATWNIRSEVLSVAYSGDGSQVAVGCKDGTVSIRNAYDGTLLVGPWNAHTRIVRSVVFSPDGRLVASGSYDGTIGVWDVRTGSPVAGPFHRHTDLVYSVSFSPDSKRIVSGSDNNTVCIWDTADGTLLVGLLHGHTDSVNSVTYSPDGTLIASASEDNTIRLWRSDDGTPAGSPLQGHTDSVNSVTFTPDGTRLVSGSSDGTVRVWRVSDGLAVATSFQGHSGGVYSVAVSPDGMLVASGSEDRTVRVWRISDGSLAAGPFVGHTIISGSDDRTVRVWNVREGMMSPASSEVGLLYITSLSFSPDGAHVLTVSREDERRMWGVSSGISQPASTDTQLPHLPSDASPPDSSYAAETNTDGRLVRVVRTDDKSVAAGPFNPTPRVWQFSRDSTCVIVGLKDGRIEGICLQTGQPAFELRSANDDWVDLIAEWPDRSLLASIDDTAYHSSSLRIWSMVSPSLCFRSSDDPPLDPGPGQTLSGLHARCYINRAGWMVNNNNDLLLWLPSEIADAGLSPFASLIVTTSGTLQVPKQMLLVGPEWDKCYVRG